MADGYNYAKKQVFLNLWYRYNHLVYATTRMHAQEPM